MPDFYQAASDGLRQLPPGIREEVAAEIASHLADQYEAYLASGMPDIEAYRLTTDGVGDWRALQREIRNTKEDEVTERARKVLLPGAVCFLVAATLERFLYAVRIWPRIVHLGSYGMFPLNWTWLGLLLLCGALGAYLATRAGASPLQRITAAVFPVVIMAAVLVPMAAIAAIVESARHGRPEPRLIQGIAAYILGFVLIPGAALMLGAAPIIFCTAKVRALR